MAKGNFHIFRRATHSGLNLTESNVKVSRQNRKESPPDQGENRIHYGFSRRILVIGRMSFFLTSHWKINKVALFHGNAGVECVAVTRVIGIIGNVGMKKAG